MTIARLSLKIISSLESKKIIYIYIYGDYRWHSCSGRDNFGYLVHFCQSFCLILEQLILLEQKNILQNSHGILGDNYW